MLHRKYSTIHKQKRGTLSSRRIFLAVLILILGGALVGCAGDPNLTAPGVTLTIDPSGQQPKQVVSGVQLFVLLTVLSLAPSILILMTSFTRIIIVLSMLRSAIGTPTIPPNQVVIGLSLLLTIFIMAPVYGQIDQTAIQPYLKNQIDQDTAFKIGMEPIREFMFKQTREKDIQLFLDLGKMERPKTVKDISTLALFPAFVISELRTAFTMGFIIFLPFLVIDMVVSSILLSMGMMMLPPSLVSLPFKILLFVMVDGWYLIARSLTISFN